MDLVENIQTTQKIILIKDFIFPTVASRRCDSRLSWKKDDDEEEEEEEERKNHHTSYWIFFFIYQNLNKNLTISREEIKHTITT